MRIEVFKIKDDNWGVRIAKGLEVTGFQSPPMAHVWTIQWLMQMMGKSFAQEALKKMLKEGQDEVDRIVDKAAKDKNDDD